MKIIIAPAKVMKTKQVNIETTDILFKDKTTQLHNWRILSIVISTMNILRFLHYTAIKVLFLNSLV